MKLSQDQIQELYKFTRKHFVEHYDLQTELVDHLANGIEEQIVQHPKLSFKEALDMVFKKFGVFGFQDVIKEKTRAMEKRYWKIIIQFYIEYFKLPKILLVFGVSVLVFFVLDSIPILVAKYLPTLLFLFLLTLFLINVAHNMGKQKSKPRKWLLDEIIAVKGNIFNILYLFLNTFLFFDFTEWILKTEQGTFALSLAIVLVVLLLYVIIKVIPSKAESLLAQTYPEYKMS